MFFGYGMIKSFLDEEARRLAQAGAGDAGLVASSLPQALPVSSVLTFDVFDAAAKAGGTTSSIMECSLTEDDAALDPYFD